MGGISESESMFSPAASTFFDLLRFGAAVLVVMEHLSSRLFVGYGYLEQPGIWTKFLYWINLLGSPGVVIFFVLSGLFISRSIYRSELLGNRDFGWSRYMIARLSRLWLVLVPALIFTFFVDQVAEVSGWVNKGSGVDVFVGNIFFVQTILVPQFGSNAPLWSISNEFWYYMIFPLLMLSVLSNNVWRRLLFLAISVALLVFIGPRKAAYFLMWLLGAAVMLLPVCRRFGGGCLLVAAAAFLVFFSLMRPLVARGRLIFDGVEIDLFWPDLMISVATFLVMRVAIVYFEGRDYFINISVDSMIRKGAAFSFSLYVVHYPLINSGYFLAHANGFRGFQPGPLGVAFEVGILALICAGAWLFASMTEMHTNTVRVAVAQAWLRVSHRGA
jgi:peptidoglycan/LPS O-acetylase OafA/YrhL